jgi:hypothetical protein
MVISGTCEARIAFSGIRIIGNLRISMNSWESWMASSSPEENSRNNES